MVTYEETLRHGGDQAIRMVSQFFGKDDALYRTLTSLTSRLTELNIPYAISGGLAMVAHGCPRTEMVVEVLVRQQAMEQIGGWTGEAPIKFLIAGSYLTRMHTSAQFPDPDEASVEIDRIRYLSLEKLVELKLALGIAGGMGRLKDLADAVEMIKTLKLPADFTMKLPEHVRPKYSELWDGIATTSDPHLTD